MSAWPRRDANPESEIRVWERITACCYLTYEQYRFSDEQMRDIFSIYLFASLGPMDEDDKKSIKHFNSQEVDEFLALFDSNLSHIEINGTEQGADEQLPARAESKAE